MNWSLAHPGCKVIKLVQVVRVLDKDAKVAPWVGPQAPLNNMQTVEDASKGIIGGFVLDHLADRARVGSATIYYRDYQPKKSQDGSSTSPATLYDEPYGYEGDTHEFETCARCVDPGGANDKKYFGCMKWGFKTNGPFVNGQLNVKFTPSSATDGPSSTFRQAVDNFNAHYGTKN